MKSSENPLISFVVPCYNYGRYSPDCVNSILNQEGEFDFEIILIDDASTDNTAEIIRSFIDPRIRVITHQVNLGHVGTVNEGLREARGAFIARIDPDDRYRPGYLLTVMEKFEAFPEVGMVYGDVSQINECGEITVERSDTQHSERDYKGNELTALMAKNFICSPSVIARREAWLNALPVPEGLAFHDWYFTLSMAREYEFYYVHRVLADYRVHGENHHSKIILNKTEETSIFWLLEHIYSEREKTPGLEHQKQRAERRIYGAQYLDMANKYFGCHYDSDARRCYLAALLNNPTYALRPEVQRRLLGTLVGRKVYEASKLGVKFMLSPLAKVFR